MRKSPQRKQPSLTASIASIRRYTGSFEGLPIGKVRDKLASGKITGKRWDGGKQLVASFPNYEVRVFFFDGKAIITSVQVLSK